MERKAIYKQVSPNIVKTFVLIFIGMAFMNSIIFGITEYRDSKKLILRDFKYISISVNRALSEAMWKNNSLVMKEIVNELLYNYNISAVQVINAETNFIEEFKVKNGRKSSISYSSSLIYTYDGKRVKVGELFIYTDTVAIFHRAKKTLGLIIFKTLLEVFVVFILLFWAFKKLFTEYLSDIETTIQNKNYIPLDLDRKNSLPLLERAFRDVLNRFFDLYFKKNKQSDEATKKILELKKTESKDIHEIMPQQNIVETTNSNQILDFLNPNIDFFRKYFQGVFIYSQANHQGLGDIYLFIEVAKTREILLLVIDYGTEINPIELSIILKDIEKELMLKYNVNNRLFALGKILDFIDKKVKSKFSENGIDTKKLQFQGLALHYDKINQKIEYSTKGILLLKEKDNKFLTYNDLGLSNDMLMQHKQTGEVRREHQFDVQTGEHLYIVTDGILQQVKKDKEREVIGSRGLMEIIKTISDTPFDSQETLLKDEFAKIKGDKPQSDNITFIGLNF